MCLKPFAPPTRFLIVAALIMSVLIIAGILYLAFGDSSDDPTQVTEVSPTGLPLALDVEKLPTFTPLPTNTLLPSETPVPTTTDAPITVTPSAAPDVTTVARESTQPAGSSCEHPDGWVVHRVQEGDTLFAFQLGAKRAGNPTTVEEILAGNCLGDTFLTIGQTLWLPEGAAENAPASQPSAPQLPRGASRTPQCPCTITVREGWRIEQIADEINRSSVAFSGADFLAFTQKGAPIPARGFLQSVPADRGLEGFMFPGTYTLQNETTAEQFRDMLLDSFEANAAGIINAAGNFGITPYELVILASIIQRESWDASEQTLVSSVFHNRRNTDRGFGATVTVMYALGNASNWWPRPRPGQMSLDSPYNTNIYKGFPPTPISNPGPSALQAAANPAQTNYLYFTGSCDGSGNAYAETYEQHLANVSCE